MTVVDKPVVPQLSQRPAGYNEFRRVTPRYMVGLVDLKGDGWYNFEYATIAPDGTAIREWQDAKEKLTKEYRQALWPEMLKAIADMLSMVRPAKLIRKQPRGTEDHLRHHQVTAVFEILGYVLENTWNNETQIFRTYTRK